MASYYVTSNQTLEAFLTANPSYDSNADTIYIQEKAVLTADQTPSKLMGNVRIEDGEYHIDGTGLPDGEVLHYVGQNGKVITPYESGLLNVTGKWIDLGTTDGTNDQTITLTGVGNYFENFPDVLQGIWIETGRRINYDGATGYGGAPAVIPEVGDWIYVNGEYGNNKDANGRIVSVSDNGDGTGYIVVNFLTQSVTDNVKLVVRKVYDDFGPIFGITWMADAVGADVKEAGVYQEFGNTVEDGVSRLSDLGSGIGGFGFSHIHAGATLTLGGLSGGFVPPSGCNIRAANINMATSDATNYPLNQTLIVASPISRHKVNGTYSTHNYDKVNFGSFYPYVDGAARYDANYCSGYSFGTIYARCKPVFTNCIYTGDAIAQSDIYKIPFTLGQLAQGALVDNCLVMLGRGSPATSSCFGDEPIRIRNSIYCRYGWVGAQGSNQGFRLNQSSNIIIENNVIFGIPDQEDHIIYSLDSFDVQLLNNKLSSDPKETIGTTNHSLIYLSSDTTLTGLEVLGNSFLLGDQLDIPNTQNVKIRAIGNREEPLAIPDTGATSRQFLGLAGTTSYVDAARVYVSLSGNDVFTSKTGVDSNLLLTDCKSGDYGTGTTRTGLTKIQHRGIDGSSGLVGSSTGLHYTSVASGSHFSDVFRSDTEGMIYTYFCDNSDTSTTLSVIAGTPRFFEGGMYLPVGCIVEIESDYYAMGHSSFKNTNTVTQMSRYGIADGSKHMTQSELKMEFQYDLNDGNGWNGTWLDLWVDSNLYNITNMVGGIKIKFRVEALTQDISAGSDVRVTVIALHTNSSLTDRINNKAPIDQNIVPVNWTVKDANDLSLLEGVSVYVVADVGGDLAEGTVIISGDTNANGFIENPSFVYTSDQPVKGRIVKGDVAPFYKDSPVSGTIGVNGLQVPAFLVADD